MTYREVPSRHKEECIRGSGGKFPQVPCKSPQVACKSPQVPCKFPVSCWKPAKCLEIAGKSRPRRQGAYRELKGTYKELGVTYGELGGTYKELGITYKELEGPHRKRKGTEANVPDHGFSSPGTHFLQKLWEFHSASRDCLPRALNS